MQDFRAGYNALGDVGISSIAFWLAKKPDIKVCSGSEAGSYLRLIDSCITQLKAQGPARTCNETLGDVGISSIAFWLAKKPDLKVDVWKTQRFADVPGTNFWTRRY